MLSRARFAGPALSLVAAFLRRFEYQRTPGGHPKVSAVEVTLFRLVIVLPGARQDHWRKP